MQVQFFFSGVSVSLTERTRLKKFISTIFRLEGKQLGHLNYIFCADEYLLNINRQYLNHDYYTDIISFDIGEPGTAINGEIYISTDRVKENATILGMPFKQELHRVIFHGALHLCGYKDKTKNQQSLMRSREDHYLMKYLK
jgi:rRNA maturation RNase YbeY